MNAVAARPSTDPDLDGLLVSPGIMVDPYPIYQQLRLAPQPFWSVSWNAWVVSRYHDVAASLQDARLSNERRQELLFADLSDPERATIAPLRHYFAQKDVIGSDPPDHRWMRAIVQKAFTPRVIDGMAERIRGLTLQVLADVRASGPTFDFVDAIAHPVPVTVIAELLGAGVEDGHLFRRWSTDILGFQGTGRTSMAAATTAQDSLLELFSYMSVLVDDRRSAPRDDLITTLATAEADDERLTRDQLLSTCNTLLTAGHETTTNLLANLLHLLLRHPTAWAELLEDRTLIGSAIEEALRYEAPKQRNFRRVSETHRLGDATLREGEMVFQVIGAANRDPDVFPDSDTFDIHRGRSNHLAFGKGIHFCLGAPLARLEARVVLETLLDEMPALHLEPGAIDWQQRVQFRGPNTLWVHDGR